MTSMVFRVYSSRRVLTVTKIYVFLIEYCIHAFFSRFVKICVVDYHRRWGTVQAMCIFAAYKLIVSEERNTSKINTRCLVLYWSALIIIIIIIFFVAYKQYAFLQKMSLLQNKHFSLLTLMYYRTFALRILYVWMQIVTHNATLLV